MKPDEKEFFIILLKDMDFKSRNHYKYFSDAYEAAKSINLSTKRAEYLLKNGIIMDFGIIIWKYNQVILN